MHAFLKISAVYSIYLIFLLQPSSAQGVAINNSGAAPDSSALLDVNSINQGVLVPRVTSAERNAIANPAEGLIIFNVSTRCPNYYSNGIWYAWCGSPDYPAGTVFCNGNPTTVVDVLNPATGKVWMDRNLGALQAATSSTDVSSYGDLYQWGRAADGHQCRNSQTTGQVSSSDQPGNSSFILSSTDWRSPQNNTLWNGVNGINNPCPSGYRIPSSAEIDAERLSWNTNNSNGAFASPLKFSSTGRRDGSTGSLLGVGTGADYWTSTVSGQNVLRLSVNSSNANISEANRSTGYPVRCIRN